MRRTSSMVVLLVVLVSCAGSPKKQAAQHLATALAATNAAREAFLDYDQTHQTHLVASAKSADEAKNRIDAYRAKRQLVVRAFTIAYSAISAAGTALAATEHRTEGASLDVAKMLFEATTAALDVKRAIDALKGASSADSAASR